MFTGLQFTIGTLAHVVRCIAESNVGMRRLQEFLDLPEYSNPVSDSVLGGSTSGCDADRETYVLDITGMNMAWNKAPKIGKGRPTLVKEYTKIHRNYLILYLFSAGRMEVRTKEEISKKVKNEANGTVDPEESKRLKEDVEQLEYIPCLFDIDLKVRKGDLVGIAGSVGSGKSSLMSAILGEMRRLTGEVSVRGGIAYVSQQEWDHGHGSPLVNFCLISCLFFFSTNISINPPVPTLLKLERVTARYQSKPGVDLQRDPP